MRQKSVPTKEPAEQVIKGIRRATRRHFSAEDKIRIVLAGLRGEESIAGLAGWLPSTPAVQPCRKAKSCSLAVRVATSCRTTVTVHGALATTRGRTSACIPGLRIVFEGLI